MKLACKAYFSLEELKENQTKEDMIKEVKEKMERSFIEYFKINYTIKEENGDIEIEGCLNI